jgi:hypothetical protein
LVLDLVLIGLGITLEPFPLIAFILVLSAEKGIWKGLAFLLGWLARLDRLSPPSCLPRQAPGWSGCGPGWNPTRTR